MTSTANNYPEYAYTFKVLAINAQSGNANIVVDYIPENKNLQNVSLKLPITPELNPNNMAEYVGKWVPRQQWFAQEMVLNYESILLSANTST
jgi:hypothetical protein